MNFLSPHFLWGLLLALPLIAVYFLKVKPRKKLTNAWFLWEKVLEEKNNSSLFHKLRSFLSLLLMLLMLFFICFGLSELSFSKNDTRDVFIVIDQSASMHTKSDGTPAIELAKSEAHSVLNALSSGQRASIVVLNESLNYLTHLSSNVHGLHKTIDAIQASSTPDPHSAGLALKQMGEILEQEEDLRLIFISDGRNAFDLSKLENVEKIIIGASDSDLNIGIIAADIQPVLASESATAMVQLSNSGIKSKEVEIEIFHEPSQTIAELIKVNVKPGVNEPLFFDLPNAESGLWKINLLHKDTLPLDDHASMILRPLPAVSVSIPTENNYFYQRCIEAFGKTSGSLQLAHSDAQVNMFHGSVPENVQGKALVFAPQGSSSFWSNLGSEVAVHVPIIEQENHGLLKHINVNDFTFPGAKQLSAPQGAQVIMRSEAGVPLIYQINNPTQTVIVVNLDPQLDDFFLYTGFVTIIYDTAMFLSGNETRLPSTYPMGVPHTAPITTAYSLPNDETVQVQKGEVLTSPHIGLHQSQQESQKASYSTALLSAQESGSGNLKQAPINLSVGSGYPLSMWLLVAGILLLITESICYHRRKAD